MSTITSPTPAPRTSSSGAVPRDKRGEPGWYARLPLDDKWISVDDPVWDDCVVKRQVKRFGILSRIS